MDRHVAALVLDEIGTLMELQGENQFRARAFFNAARALHELDGDLEELVETGALEQVRGFGPATVEVVRELAATGASTLHNDLRARTPLGLFDMLRLPGLGAKRVHRLYRELGITSLTELERAAQEDRIADLSGFGPKTQARLLEGIAYARAQMGRRRQPEALATAGWLVAFLRGTPGVVRVEAAGELRRRLETVGGLDVVAAVADRAGPVLDALEALPGAVNVERIGTGGARILLADGVEVRASFVPEDAYAAALVHATGSGAHVAALVELAERRGLRLNEYGLWQGEERVRLEGEESLYGALGLEFVPPELRETGNEVDRAGAGTLPRLVTAGDLMGCFHCHTTYSDGKATVTEMAEAAAERGWRYLGLADHSQGAAYAGGLSVDDIARQHEEVDAWNEMRGHELWVFKGIEADILADGRLDYADAEEDVLAGFDYVVASIHSGFGMDQAEMTARVIRALDSPHVTFLGHPTGRLLLGREGYKLDLDAVIDAAGERGVAIEINANPRRLDLDWRHWPRAREKGVLAAINPDAHSVDGLDDVEYGVGVARKAWLTAEDVINTWDLDAVKRFLRERRTG